VLCIFSQQVFPECTFPENILLNTFFSEKICSVRPGFLGQAQGQVDEKARMKSPDDKTSSVRPGCYSLVGRMIIPAGLDLDGKPQITL